MRNKPRQHTDDAAEAATVRALYTTPLFSADEELQLFTEYQRTHDPALRDRLILANTRWACEIARHYHPRGAMTAEDIEQEAMLGLMTAVEKFDPTRGYKFSTYATHWIRQRVSRALADQAELIREPVHVQQKRSHAIKHGDAATLPRQPWRVLSLDAPLLDEFGSDEPDGATLKGIIPAPECFEEAVTETAYLRSTLYRALGMLPERQRYVIALRYGLHPDCDGDCWTLTRIGDAMQLTRERVRQIEASALTRLRQLLAQTEDGDACLRMLALVAKARSRHAHHQQAYRERQRASASASKERTVA